MTRIGTQSDVFFSLASSLSPEKKVILSVNSADSVREEEMGDHLSPASLEFAEYAEGNQTKASAKKKVER